MKRKDVAVEIDEYTHQIDVLETQLAELKEYADKFKELLPNYPSHEEKELIKKYDKFITTI